MPDFKTMGTSRIDMAHLRYGSQISDDSIKAQGRHPPQHRILRYVPRAAPAGSFRPKQRLCCDLTFLIKKFGEHTNSQQELGLQGRE